MSCTTYTYPPLKSRIYVSAAGRVLTLGLPEAARAPGWAPRTNIQNGYWLIPEATPHSTDRRDRNTSGLADSPRLEASLLRTNCLVLHGVHIGRSLIYLAVVQRSTDTPLQGSSGVRFAGTQVADEVLFVVVILSDPVAAKQPGFQFEEVQRMSLGSLQDQRPHPDHVRRETTSA